MAYSSSSSYSEVSNDSTCSKSCLETVEVLKSQYEQLLKRFEKSELMVLAYKTGLQSVEKRLEFYKKNESVYVEKINSLKWDIQVGEITIGELRKKLEIVQKEKDGIQFNVDKFENTSKILNKIIKSQIVDNFKKILGYSAIPSPLKGNFMPPKPDLSFTGLEEFTNEPVVIKPVVENSEAKACKAKPKVVRKNNGAPIIEDWVSDSEEENVSQTKIEKKIAKPSFVKIDFVKAKQTNKTDRKTAKQGTYPILQTMKDNSGGYVVLEGLKGGKITGIAVNTACYVQNRVLVVKPHNKTPYELFHGRTPTLSFMRPFGCHVTIINTVDHLGKFDGKADKGFCVGYSLNSKAFRVFNSGTRIVEENLHIRFSESTPNVVGTKASDNAVQARKEIEPIKNYILIPLWSADLPFSQDPKSSQDDGSKPSGDDEKKVDEYPRKDSKSIDQEKDDNVNSTNNVNAASMNKVNAVGGKTSIELPDDLNKPASEDISIFDLLRDNEDVGAEADINNLGTTI
ncbi:ribonuclease H-like domain-containing protein [Tanacetum coccineum]